MHSVLRMCLNFKTIRAAGHTQERMRLTPGVSLVASINCLPCRIVLILAHSAKSNILTVGFQPGGRQWKRSDGNVLGADRNVGLLQSTPEKRQSAQITGF